MRGPLTREEFATQAGRRHAERDLFVSDHGFLRAIYDNAHEIAPGVFRSAQPSPSRLKQWKERGIKTVINLRGPKVSNILLLEESACKDIGLEHVPFRVFSREAPSADIINGLDRLFDAVDRPFLMHCKSGADRVGLASALYLFLKEGVQLPDALQQLSLRYGHIKFGKTGVIDEAFQEYQSYAAENSLNLSDRTSFLEWVNGPYDHLKTKERFRSSWIGDVLTEKILRRE
ncbi:MAG: protein tyrosine phosphatase [Pseudomonadota bacterium]